LSGRKVFVAGEVLQAADVNDYLMDQSVMVFAGTAARGSAIPSPSEGMVTYRSDDDVVEVFDGSVFAPVGVEPAILQVVSTIKTNTFSTSSFTFTDVTGLTASITPKSTSSKIYLAVTVGALDASTATELVGRVLRDSTPIGVGDAADTRSPAAFFRINNANNRPESMAWSFLDSPGTTSSTAYQVQVRAGGGTLFLNRSGSDSNSEAVGRTVSTITLMEVAG
jgi:hypothetical protein